MIFIIFLLFSLVASHPSRQQHQRNCRDIHIPVSLVSRNGKFLVPPARNNLEVTGFILTAGRQGINGTAAALEDYVEVSGDYTIAATYCTPMTGPGKAIQILTHGIGFDRTYWDSPFNNRNYSYVDRALAAGYSTLAHDRLGIGKSSRGDPVQAIQASLEIQALRELTYAVGNGTIPNVPAYKTIYHAGHSFGSIQTFALTRDYPDISDGIILTGFAQNGSFISGFLFGGNFVAADTIPALKDSYSAGYLAVGDMSGLHNNFFSPTANPGLQFDPAMLDYAFKTGQPVTQGELLTTGGAAFGANTFAGPVLIITGERDLPFCGGDCLNTGIEGLSSIPAAAVHSFPKSTGVEVVIVPEAGHGLNFEYSHAFTYGKMLDFLEGKSGPSKSKM